MSIQTARVAIALFALSALSACTTLVKSPPVASTLSDAQAIEAYSRVLQKFVNDDGEVDFAALREDRADLDRYVAYIGAKQADQFINPKQRLAHYLNSYNALSMYNVLASDIPRTHAGLAKLRFFVLRKLMIGGEWRSLYSYENDIIRKLGEPRVHFALNCSAVSCPALPRAPFSAQNLEQELERETRKFFANPRNLRVDHTQRRVHLSEILRFYQEDFVPAPAPSLIAYINAYIDPPVPESYEVKFIKYDWTIANSKRERGR